MTEDLADELARDVIKAVEATGDEMIISDVQKILGSTSQTAEEAFLTAVRVRRATPEYQARRRAPSGSNGAACRMRAR